MVSQRGDKPAAFQGAPAAPATSRAGLPVWPLYAMFGGFPVWWVLGVVDFVWLPIAGVMALYLQRAGSIRAPRGFGLWMLFLLWVACSFVAVLEYGGAFQFVYRYSMYVSATVFFVYVYNARSTMTSHFVTGTMTVWWIVTVAGGYLGILLPGTVFRTPMSYVVPQGLLGNDLVNAMVIRRFAQYNPDSFLQVEPRPSAPFLYTNNWGNVYSLLLPLVVVYLLHVRGTRRFWLLTGVALLSAVPAALTLNRGMFLAIGVSAVFVAGRLALQRDYRGMAGLAVLGVLSMIALQVLPVADRLDNRLSGDSNSNTTRTTIYAESLSLVTDSPLFGFGGPQPNPNPQAAPIGTQGQVWLLLVSHGPFATALFVGFFVYCFWRIRRRRDPTGLACATVMLVGTMELFYYGVVPNGLPLMMVAAGLGMRDSGGTK